MVDRKNLKYVLPILLILIIKAWWVAAGLSDAVSEEVASIIAADSELKDQVSVDIDGLNVDLTGPADLESKSVNSVRELSKVRNINYFATEKDPAPIVVVDEEVDPGSTRVLNELQDLFLLEPIQFASLSSSLTDDSALTLDKAVEVILKADESQRFRVVGHTDSDGLAESNERLSLRRAESVVAYLVAEGIDPSRLVSEGRGSTELKVQEKSLEDKQINRRIEWEIL